MSRIAGRSDIPEPERRVRALAWALALDWERLPDCPDRHRALETLADATDLACAALAASN